MSYAVKFYEEYGPEVNGRGTVIEATNINFKNLFDYEIPYYTEDASIKRPDKYSLGTSWTKYVFFKFTGDLPNIKDIKVIIAKIPDATDTPTVSCSKVQLFYGLTNDYAYGDGQLDGHLTFMPEAGITLFPSWGEGSPSNASMREPLLVGGLKTIFTNYIKLQMHIRGDEDWHNVGNTPQYELKLEFNSF